MSGRRGSKCRARPAWGEGRKGRGGGGRDRGRGTWERTLKGIRGEVMWGPGRTWAFMSRRRILRWVTGSDLGLERSFWILVENRL